MQARRVASDPEQPSTPLGFTGKARAGLTPEHIVGVVVIGRCQCLQAAEHGPAQPSSLLQPVVVHRGPKHIAT